MFKERKILIVDDEEGIRKLLTRGLARLGCSVQSAASAEEGLEVMQRSPAEILFLDLHLPGMSGVDLCREIRRRWPWSIPIAFTGYASVFQLVECREAGFDDYFVKPVDLKELLDAAEYSCRKFERWKRR